MAGFFENVGNYLAEKMGAEKGEGFSGLISDKLGDLFSWGGEKAASGAKLGVNRLMDGVMDGLGVDEDTQDKVSGFLGKFKKYLGIGTVIGGVFGGLKGLLGGQGKLGSIWEALKGALWGTIIFGAVKFIAGLFKGKDKDAEVAPAEAPELKKDFNDVKGSEFKPEEPSPAVAPVVSADAPKAGTVVVSAMKTVESPDSLGVAPVVVASGAFGDAAKAPEAKVVDMSANKESFTNAVKGESGKPVVVDIPAASKKDNVVKLHPQLNAEAM